MYSELFSILSQLQLVISTPKLIFSNRAACVTQGVQYYLPYNHYNLAMCPAHISHLHNIGIWI